MRYRPQADAKWLIPMSNSDEAPASRWRVTLRLVYPVPSFMVVSMSTRCLKQFLACGLFVLGMTVTTEAQITPRDRLSVSQSKTASLEEYLVNRLRATTPDQQSYVREIIRLQEQGLLEKRLLIALERYSRRKSPFLPLVVFERALRIEAGKRRVAVPTLKDIVARNGVSAARSISDSRNR